VLFTGSIDELLARTKGRAWVAEVDRQRLHEMKEQYIFTGVQRAGDNWRIRLVAEEVAGGEVTSVEPTLEDAYLDIMGLAEDDGDAV